MPLCTCTLKSLTACRLGDPTQWHLHCNSAALCKELPWDISFWHNSLAYWIERANIIPHYAARNLLDSTGILVLGSQTIELWARNVWAGRTGLDYWHLTNGQLYLHTPCFPPNTPSCAKASHETPNAARSEGINYCGWLSHTHSALSLFCKRKSDWQLGSPLSLNLNCHHIWATGWHTSQRADYGNLHRHLSALCLPLIPLSPTQPNYCLPPCQGAQQTLKSIIWISLRYLKKCFADMNVRMSRVCTYASSSYAHL